LNLPTQNTPAASKRQTDASIEILGDFSKNETNSDGLGSINNFIWSLYDDSMANGKSQGSIEVVAMPSALSSLSNEDNGVLKVKAIVNAGFPYPWAGAAVGDSVLPVEGKDISEFTNLVFDVKGSAGTYRVMSFDVTAARIPPSQSFQVSDQWQTIKLPLAGFIGLNTKVVSGFSFLAGPDEGEFEFYLDNIRVE
ncbi:MAG: hypothetical protein ACJAVV_002823, partial [Alphaproteobacteria bacterium]